MKRQSYKIKAIETKTISPSRPAKLKCILENNKQRDNQYYEIVINEEMIFKNISS